MLLHLLHIVFVTLSSEIDRVLCNVTQTMKQTDGEWKDMAFSKDGSNATTASNPSTTPHVWKTPMHPTTNNNNDTSNNQSEIASKPGQPPRSDDIYDDTTLQMWWTSSGSGMPPFSPTMKTNLSDTDESPLHKIQCAESLDLAKRPQDNEHVIFGISFTRERPYITKKVNKKWAKYLCERAVQHGWIDEVKEFQCDKILRVICYNGKSIDCPIYHIEFTAKPLISKSDSCIRPLKICKVAVKVCVHALDKNPECCYNVHNEKVNPQCKISKGDDKDCFCANKDGTCFPVYAFKPWSEWSNCPIKKRVRQCFSPGNIEPSHKSKYEDVCIFYCQSPNCLRRCYTCRDEGENLLGNACKEEKTCKNLSGSNLPNQNSASGKFPSRCEDLICPTCNSSFCRFIVKYYPEKCDEDVNIAKVCAKSCGKCDPGIQGACSKPCSSHERCQLQAVKEEDCPILFETEQSKYPGSQCTNIQNLSCGINYKCHNTVIQKDNKSVTTTQILPMSGQLYQKETDSPTKIYTEYVTEYKEFKEFNSSHLL